MEESVRLLGGSINVTASITTGHCVKQVQNILVCVCARVHEQICERNYNHTPAVSATGLITPNVAVPVTVKVPVISQNGFQTQSARLSVRHHWHNAKL